MKGISKFYAALFTFAFGVILTMVWFSCRTTSSQQIADDKVIAQTNVESNQTKEELKPENDEASCLSAEYPKRKGKYTISAGVLNIKAIDIPKPEYPAKAKAKKITGEVKASVFVDESGKVVWARVDNGHPLLQEAVKKVVCQPLFKPATISGHPYSVSGFITYKFVLP
jgi:TonB family protein